MVMLQELYSRVDRRVDLMVLLIRKENLYEIWKPCKIQTLQQNRFHLSDKSGKPTKVAGLMKTASCKTVGSSRNLTLRARMIVLTKLIKPIKIRNLAYSLMPKPGSNRKYRQSQFQHFHPVLSENISVSWLCADIFSHQAQTICDCRVLGHSLRDSREDGCSLLAGRLTESLF